MRTTTPAWTTAVQHVATQTSRSAAYEPIVLVDLTTLARYFATRRLTTSARAYEYDVARLDQGGVQALHIDLDEMAGTVRLSGMAIRLLNLEQLWQTLSGVLDNTSAQIWLSFVGLDDADALPLFAGVVDRHSFSRTSLDLALVDSSFRVHRDLSVAIGGQYFPGAPQSSRTLFIPIILGRAIDAPTMQISGVAQGTLAFPLASAANELYLVEMGAPFPPTGVVTIGADATLEASVTYSARDLVLRSGVTYLRLSGLARATPLVHDLGTSVALVSSAFAYLIGYEVRSLQGVRDNGAPVTSDAYTLVTLQADRPVSALLFTEQRGVVTVDVNGPNVDLDERVVNGGFESGDLTGWTLGAGSALVASANPEPYVGLYRAALVAPASGADALLAQDIAVLPGATYVLRLVYRNAQGVSALANAGFETGDLTSWAISNIWAGTSYAIVRANSPPGSYQSTFGYRPVYLGPAAGGTYFLEVSTRDAYQYHLSIYQDLTTVVSGEYALRAHMKYAFEHSYANIGHAPYVVEGDAMLRAGSQTSLPVAAFANMVVSYMLGTPTSPGQYAIGRLESAELLPFDWNRSRDVTFTATTTTTRVTITLQGSFTNVIPLPVMIDDVQLEQVGAFATSTLRLDLGTPLDSDALSTTTYGAVYGWTPIEQVVRIPDEVETLRLTLRSTYNGGSPLASFLDQISLRLGYSAAGLGGENPIDAIRYVLDTFLPNATYDATSFYDAAQQLMGWKFGAVLTNPGDSRALLQRMAFQCGSLLFQDGLGQYKVTVLNNTRVVRAGFTLDNMVVDSCTISVEPIDNLYTDLYVWFAAKTGGGVANADFQGVAYATPTGTTATSVPLLVTQCGAARDLYGREHRLDYYADFIQDIGTAHLLLTWLVARRTIRHSLVTFRTWLDGVVVEIGDLVHVTHPLVGNGRDPLVCEVVGQRVDFATMQIELVVRTLTLAGWSADFEYSVRVLDDAGWSSAFEDPEA